MELLQLYDTENESNDESEGSNSTPNSGMQGSMHENEKLENYFGLHGYDSDDSSDDKSAKKRQRTETGIREFEIDNTLVEIPRSEFWAQISPKEVIKNQRKHGTNSWLKNPELKDSSEVIRSKSDKCNSDIKALCQHSSMKVADISSSRQSSKQGKPFEDNPRKIFYIHSKIMPILNSRTTNKPPSKVEKQISAHGSVANRINWNIPQFSHLLLSVGMDMTLKIWNPWSTLDPCVKTVMVHTKAVKDAVWSSDGRSILSCSYDRTAALTDVETGKCLCKLHHDSFVTCGKFHPVMPKNVLTGATGSIQSWDTRTPDGPYRRYHYKDKLGQVQDVLFTRDGQQFFSSCDVVSRDSADRNLMAWDYSTGVPLSNQIYQERYTCLRLKLHPTEGQFLAQTQGNYIAVFSINKPYKMVKSKRFEGHKLLGYNVGFDISPDGSLVLSGSSDGIIHCYNNQTGKCWRTLNTGLEVCTDTVFHPVLHSTIACCSWGGEIKIFH